MSAITRLITDYSGQSAQNANLLFKKFSPNSLASNGNQEMPSRVLKDPHLRFGKSTGLENRKYWAPHDKEESTFTDPKEFDPRAFQFIVHVIGPNRMNTINNPEETFNQRLLSCSIVNQSKKTTFVFNNGFILKVPQSNIYATTPCDMYLYNKAMDKDLALGKLNKNENLDKELSRVNSKYGISTPEDILKRTQPHKINEVAVLGKNVKVIGVFRKVLNGKKGTTYPGIHKESYKLYEKYAKEHHLPIVDIPIDYLTAKQRLKKEGKMNQKIAQKYKVQG